MEELRRFGLRVGDVLITKDSESWTDIAVPALVVATAPDLVCGYHLATLRGDPVRLFGPFLFRALQSKAINQQFQLAASGVTRFGLPKDAIGGAVLPIPPLNEQRTIADFLDRETARFDTLLAKKRELIEKLQEKRNALISRTVTRGLPPEAARAAGLNPHPKLRPSGVGWLGDIPEHWEVRRLKTGADYRISSVDKVASDEEIPVRLCNYTDVYSNAYISPDMELMESTATVEELRRFGLRVGDVLITKDSESWTDIAAPALVVATAPDLVCGYHLAILRGDPVRLFGPFLFRALQSKAINQQFQLAASGVTRFGLPKDAIGGAVLPMPPLNEQRTIADYLDRETAQIDQLTTKVRTAIDRLDEYRSALITAAVTGKIDVRAAGA